MLNISLSMDAKDVERLLADVNSGKVGDALGVAMHDARNLVTSKAMSTVHVITGNLRRSLSEGGLALTGRSGDFAARAVAGSNVEYAPMEEFGGTIPAHDIVPRFASVLHWTGKDGVERFARKVHVPDVTRQGHPYLAPAVEGQMPQIRSLIVRRLAAVLRAQGGA